MPRRFTGGEFERFMRGRHVAVLATVSEKGDPVLTPIWYLYRDGRFFMRTAQESAKARNMRRDPRASLCVQDERPPYRSATVYGRAALAQKDEGLGATIARHYLGAVAGAAYARAAGDAVEQGEEVTIILTPEKVMTQDFSAETPFVGRLWLKMRRVLPPWL